MYDYIKNTARAVYRDHEEYRSRILGARDRLHEICKDNDGTLPGVDSDLWHQEVFPLAIDLPPKGFAAVLFSVENGDANALDEHLLAHFENCLWANLVRCAVNDDRRKNTETTSPADSSRVAVHPLVMPCLGCGKDVEVKRGGYEESGVFNVFCQGGECEDRYAAKL